MKFSFNFSCVFGGCMNKCIYPWMYIYLSTKEQLQVLFFSYHLPWFFLKQGLLLINRFAGCWGNSVSKALWLQVHAAISQCFTWAIQIKFTGYDWSASILQCHLCIPTQTHTLYFIVSLHLEFQQAKRGNMNQS